jgi:hypothetical protein
MLDAHLTGDSLRNIPFEQRELLSNVNYIIKPFQQIKKASFNIGKKMMYPLCFPAGRAGDSSLRGNVLDSKPSLVVFTTTFTATFLDMLFDLRFIP